MHESLQKKTCNSSPPNYCSVVRLVQLFLIYTSVRVVRIRPTVHSGCGGYLFFWIKLAVSDAGIFMFGGNGWGGCFLFLESAI